MIHASSNPTRPIDDLDPDAVPVGLARLARDTKAAATLADQMARSESIHREGPVDRGGPTPDEPLRQLIRRLAIGFHHYLQERPTNVVNSEDGASVSLFDEFARRAFAQFSPGLEPIPNSAIEKKTRRIVASWDDIELVDEFDIYGLPK